jgi:hypothetical protein
MQQRMLIPVLILAACVLLMGMGGSGGFERAPRVEKNFAVTVSDVGGSTIKGEKFSWEGRIYFSGTLGMAQVTMPFDRIQSLTVGEIRDRKAKVTALLLDGAQAVFEIDAKSRCFGEAPFGSFMLEMSEIKSIAFKK